MKEAFDTIAAGQSSYAVPIAVQERHLAVLRDLVALPSVVRRKPVSRRAAIVAISVVVLAGAGVGTAAAFGAFSKPTDRGVSHCYTAASLDAAHNDFALATATGAPGDSAAYALDICQRDWRNGRLQQGADSVKEPDAAGRTFAVPPLTVCVLKSGQVAVFPWGNRDLFHPRISDS